MNHGGNNNNNNRRARPRRSVANYGRRNAAPPPPPPPPPDEDGDNVPLPREDDDDDDDRVEREEEEEEEEEHNDENEDNDDENDNNNLGEDNNGVIEGGVAVANGTDPADGAKSSTDCDLILLLQCHEDLQTLPRSVAKRGTTVRVGLDKTTKLYSVFSHFARFCTLTSKNKEPLSESDLEFVHDQVLSGTETAEGSALMKNDVVKVRKRRAEQEESRARRERMQRESDAIYFRQMKRLLCEGLTNHHNNTHDLIIECRGTLKDKKTNNLAQNPRHETTTALRAHRAIISKRSPWFKDHIRRAVEAKQFHPVVRIPNDAVPIENHPTPTNHKGNLDRAANDDDDDDDDAVQPLPLPSGDKNHDVGGGPRPLALAGDKDNDRPAHNELNPAAEVVVRVVLERHPPEAVELFLEYCYTNRCAPLGGRDDDARPLVSMSTALAGVELAEEARAPRFASLCETAATRLVRRDNVTDALCSCAASDNGLPRLRERAMACLLERRVLEELASSTDFVETLRERSGLLVPAVLTGLVDAEDSRKRRRSVDRRHGHHHQHHGGAHHHHRPDHHHHHRHGHHHGGHRHRRRFSPSSVLQGIVWRRYDEEDRIARESERRKYAERRKRRRIERDASGGGGESNGRVKADKRGDLRAEDFGDDAMDF